jgi:hypothetical protein
LELCLKVTHAAECTVRALARRESNVNQRRSANAT